MRVFSVATVFLLAIVFTAASAAEKVVQPDGAAVAAELTRRYNDTRPDCGKNKEPAFKCSGVILRGTDDTEKEKYNIIDPSPKAKEVGGVSFSFARADVPMKRMAYGYTHGYVVFPPDTVPAGKTALQARCFFPIDGESDKRSDNGCGGLKTAPETGKACDLQGIETGDAWRQRFDTATTKFADRCAFDVRETAGQNAGKNFYQGILARASAEHSSDVPNDLKMVLWDHTKVAQFPMEALIHTNDDGLRVARYDQKWMYRQTGIIVPIVKVQFSDKGGMQFSYDKNSQHTLATIGCEKYIESTRWGETVLARTGKSEKMLTVIPSDCARTAGSDEAEAMYKELYALNGQDANWKDHELAAGSMRRQFTCYFDNYRSRDDWNLEPLRDYVDSKEATDQKCNPWRTNIPEKYSTGKCTRYIANAKWELRPADYMKDKQWALMVKPTECGREIGPSETEAFYEELVFRYGLDKQWVENDNGGMRRQLVCHFVLARSKAKEGTWNLEPFRPNVDHAESIANACNPVPAGSKPGS